LSDQRRHNRHRGDSNKPGHWSRHRPADRPGDRRSSHSREGSRRQGGASDASGHTTGHAQWQAPGHPSGRSTGGRPPVRGDRARVPGPQGPPLTDQIKRIDPFDLFCAYHLGITTDKQYRPLNLHDVARRFNVDGSVIKQALQAYGMDADALLNTEFDLTMAQLDIQVAPEGVDRVELARGIYEEFRRAPRKQRDWKRVLEDDARENAKIFGRR
jgi:hypothetical protein